MKTVPFCGGLGTRIRDVTGRAPFRTLHWCSSDDIEIASGASILRWIDPGAGSIAESVDDVAQGSGAHSKIEVPPFSNAVFVRERL
jgi:hypothetical protein